MPDEQPVMSTTAIARGQLKVNAAFLALRLSHARGASPVRAVAVLRPAGACATDAMPCLPHRGPGAFNGVPSHALISAARASAPSSVAVPDLRETLH